MARRMSLSEPTIQDHLKPIFAKTGAHDRVTILSRALGPTLRTTSRPGRRVAMLAGGNDRGRPHVCCGEAGPWSAD
jgi:hypothetical protein